MHGSPLTVKKLKMTKFTRPKGRGRAKKAVAAAFEFEMTEEQRRQAEIARIVEEEEDKAAQRLEVATRVMQRWWRGFSAVRRWKMRAGHGKAKRDGEKEVAHKKQDDDAEAQPEGEPSELPTEEAPPEGEAEERRKSASRSRGERAVERLKRRMQEMSPEERAELELQSLRAAKEFMAYQKALYRLMAFLEIAVDSDEEEDEQARQEKKQKGRPFKNSIFDDCPTFLLTV